MRAAIYFTPPVDAPLTKAASLWLGRDAFEGEATRAPDPEIDPLVAEPARYGFHATIRAPFQLRDGHDLSDVDARLASFAASRAAFEVPDVALRRLGPFFALTPETMPEDLQELEAAVLEAFEPLRAPLTEAEVERRQPGRLTELQRGYLERWGYPHVLQAFRFHLTLTGPVDADRTDAVEATLRDRFGSFEGHALRVGALAVFVEPAPGAPFRVRSLHSFGAP